MKERRSRLWSWRESSPADYTREPTTSARTGIAKLGFDPYPGTLNVTVTGENLEKKRHVERGPGLRIEGFSDGERSFGACTCYPLVLNDEVEGALLVADRSIHEPEVLEIVSPHYIRKRLELSDGDTVRVRFVPLRLSVS